MSDDLEELQKKEWARPPVDDVGYIPSTRMLAMSDSELRTLVEKFRNTRYTGWRNFEGKWRKYMGLDNTTGKTILDFGCGVGIESLELVLKSNNLIVADLVPENVALTKRIVNLYGKQVQTKIVSWNYPYLDLENHTIDILYMNGVLHHIPYAHDLIKTSLKWLKPGGEIRAMLYSDKGWIKYTKSDLPLFDSDVTQHPLFNKFLRVFDRVGYHADWYSKERLLYRFGDLVNITAYDYITNDDRYCVVRMIPK
jgi:SAM-dependent methyltransferase